VEWRGRCDLIEYAFIHPEKTERPLVVFLHEGLGSLEMWKTFPHELCAAASCRGLVLSRWGYGKSTPRKPDEHWPVDFMHHQACDFLPAFFRALDLDVAVDKPWFYGH